MNQVKVRLTNKHLDFQNKPHSLFSNKKHMNLMYRMAYKVSIIIKIPLINEIVSKRLKYGDLKNKPIRRINNTLYSYFIADKFNLYNSKITSVIPLKQTHTDMFSYYDLSGREFEVLNDTRYRDMQQKNQYKIDTIIKI